MDLLVLSGGRHPYGKTTPILVDFLHAAGHQIQVTENSSVLISERLLGYDGVVYKTRREAELTLTREEQIELTRFVGGGREFICLHISGCRPESWPEYHGVSGGGWITGICDFITNDELYIELGLKTGNQVFMTADLGGQTYPMAWTRSYGYGKVFQTTWVAFSRLCFSS